MAPYYPLCTFLLTKKKKKDESSSLFAHPDITQATWSSKILILNKISSNKEANQPDTNTLTEISPPVGTYIAPAK